MSPGLRDRRGVRRLEGGGPGPFSRPASWVYGLGTGLFHWLHDRGLLRKRRARLPVVSVGALSAGGSGKTPVVRWLASRLVNGGRRPAILTRGYGSRGGHGPRVVRTDDADAARDGDEPALLARSLRGVPVVVGADRARSAECARANGAAILLLDDGFQHRRLHRDLDIVLWDRRSWSAQGALLPAGCLRESVRGLARADVLLLVDRGDGVPPLPATGGGRVFQVRLLLESLSPVASGAALHALTGIADGAAFESALDRAGFALTGSTRYPDHHLFTEAEIREAAKQAAGEGADHLAVTAKDYVRWPRGAEAELAVPAVFDLGVEVDRESELLRMIADRTERGGE